jgi:hypothetical protein
VRVIRGGGATMTKHGAGPITRSEQPGQHARVVKARRHSYREHEKWVVVMLTHAALAMLCVRVEHAAHTLQLCALLPQGYCGAVLLLQEVAPAACGL